jgi:YfiH family protein
MQDKDNQGESFFVATSTKEDGNMDFRFGSESEALSNREKFLTKHKLSPADCLVMELEHQDKIVIVDAGSQHHSLGTVVAEALITQQKNLALFLLTADCLPVVLYDPVTHTVALAHLGRKPTEKKLLPQVIRTMENAFQVTPNNLQVFIGPGIHKESYIFDILPPALSPEWQPFITHLPSGKFSLDILNYNKSQLTECGVLEKNIIVSPVDTYQNQNYFSHCRSLKTGEPEGRFATVCWLGEE